jgi:hypothetical protein
MKRKKSIYKGLQFQPVWFDDRSLTSPDYFQISEFPTRLTSGKNLFKLRGHPSNLEFNSALDIEILDYNNNTIYYEILDYLDDDKSRVVAVYIYEDSAAGDCTITVTAEAKDVPENWKGRQNIRWSRTLPVNPNISNDTEIIFETIPAVSLTEQIGPHLDRIYSGSVQFPTYSDGVVKYFSYNGQPAVELIGGSFIKDMANGIITINTPTNPSPTAPYTPDTAKYTSAIKKVLSPTLALLDTEYKVFTSAALFEHTYYSFEASSYSLNYEATPLYVETQNSESYALIEIKGLQPSTGDVSRIKVFMNNKGTVGTWELINDIELEETELFIANTASLYPDRSIGLFTSQSIIDTYWQGYTYQGNTVATAPTLIYDTASLNDAMQIVNTIDISAKNTVSIAQIKPQYSAVFVKDSEYKITFDALGIKTGTDAVLSVYASGSAFTMDYTDYYNQELPVKLGKRIGQFAVNGNRQRYDDVVIEFAADYTGTAVLLFVVESGEWQIADIRTTSDNDSGFTPNYTRIKTLVPTAHKANNQITFKTEYYNVAGVKSKQINYVYNKKWEGGNRYIDGNYSMITGSLYVADSLETGIAISGYKNSGFIRSLGYQGFEAGFPGLVLWSGSALPGSAGTKGAVPYSGVGLELYADLDNYFRYSTTDSELDIRTNTIFVGNSASSFISSSNGNLQISSSNFQIDANGNVRIRGYIDITDGTGFETPASVSASIGSATSSLSSSISNTITNLSSSTNTTITNLSSSTALDIQNAVSLIVTDVDNRIIKPNDTPSGGAGLYLSQRYLGHYAGSEWKSYISSSGEFLFQKDLNNRISFGNDSFVLKVSDTAIISGSQVNLITPSFFFGGVNQYVSGSDGKIAISSSNFYLDDAGNVTLSGVVNITSGTGFETPASVSASIGAATSSLSSSINTTITNISSSTGTTITNLSSSTNTAITNLSSSTNATITNLSSSTANDIQLAVDRIVTDANNKITKTNNTPAGGPGLFLSSKYLGYYDNTTWNAYISSSGEFLFQKDTNNLISFGNNAFTLKVSDAATISGSQVNLITPNFLFGDTSNFISGSGGNIQISGSNVSIETPKFFLGNKDTQYVSGSNTQIEISSSNFHLKANGQITASGIDITGVSKRNIIQDKTVVITPTNSSSYITTVSENNSGGQFLPEYQILWLDGTQGGEKVQRVELRFNSPIKTGQSGSTLVTYPVAISSIKLPQIGSNNQVTCTIEVASGSVVYINNSVGSFSKWFAYTYPGYIEEGGFTFDYSSDPIGPGNTGGGGFYE